MTREKNIIGSNIKITVAGIENIPAKVDTGADSSAIWATNQRINESGELEFELFAPKTPYYTGETITTRQFRAKTVRSSLGDQDIRYQVKLPAVIAGRKIQANFTLADRSQNKFPILIGRKTLRDKFIVDVSEFAIKPRPVHNSLGLNLALKTNPHKFHQKYMINSKKREK